jgi:serine/threonine-protein kinase
MLFGYTPRAVKIKPSGWSWSAQTMNSQIFFDPRELKQGNYLQFETALRSDSGTSYELEEWIGRGGNASVFRCSERTSGKEVAIKFLLQPGYKSAKRFLREIQLLKSIKSDHITTYHGSGRVLAEHKRSKRKVKIPFIVMELADCNLQELMRSAAQPISYEKYSGQFRGLASALADLHGKAVHRDIKPENILITGERWLLSDYGLCTFVAPGEEDLTGERQNVGPKFWLSPEAHNRRLGHADCIDAASDVFQLASIFWYVATGRHPSGIVSEEDWRGPTRLFEILHRALLHDTRKRPQNGNEFLAELEGALNV